MAEVSYPVFPGPQNGSFRLLSIIGSVIIALAGAFSIITAYVGPLQLQLNTVDQQVILHTRALGEMASAPERMASLAIRVDRMETEIKQRIHDVDIKIQTEIKAVADLSTARDRELDTKIQQEMMATKALLAERIAHASDMSGQQTAFGKEGRLDLLERLVQISNRLDVGLRDVEAKSAEQVRTTNALLQLEVRKLDEKLQRELTVLQERLNAVIGGNSTGGKMDEHVRRIAEGERRMDALQRLLDAYIGKSQPSVPR